MQGQNSVIVFLIVLDSCCAFVICTRWFRFFPVYKEYYHPHLRRNKFFNQITILKNKTLSSIRSIYFNILPENMIIKIFRKNNTIIFVVNCGKFKFLLLFILLPHWGVCLDFSGITSAPIDTTDGLLKIHQIDESMKTTFDFNNSKMK